MQLVLIDIINCTDIRLDRSIYSYSFSLGVLLIFSPYRTSRHRLRRIKLPLSCYQLFAPHRPNVEEPSRNVLIHRARPRPRPKVRTSFAFQPVVSRRWQQMEVVAKSSPCRRFTIQIDHVAIMTGSQDLSREKKRKHSKIAVRKLRRNITASFLPGGLFFFLCIFL